MYLKMYFFLVFLDIPDTYSSEISILWPRRWNNRSTKIKIKKTLFKLNFAAFCQQKYRHTSEDRWNANDVRSIPLRSTATSNTSVSALNTLYYFKRIKICESVFYHRTSLWCCCCRLATCDEIRSKSLMPIAMIQPTTNRSTSVDSHLPLWT